MLNSQTRLALLRVGVLVALPTGTVAAPDNSLGITLSLESNWSRYSDTQNLTFVVEFKNQLNEPLRWHPRHLDHIPYNVATLRIQGADGRRFVAYIPSGYALDEERTEVLQPQQSSFFAWELLSVVEVDDRWVSINSPDPAEIFAYQGPLPVGEYDLWVSYWDGPALSAAFPERAPARGIYTSNQVHFSVIADDAEPPFPPPCLAQGKGRVFKHRSVDLARLDGLKSYKIESSAANNTLVLKRGKRQVALPLAGAPTPRGGKGGPPLPALRVGSKDGTATHYVPLRYVAEKLGLRVRYDAMKKLYDLKG